MRWLVGGAVAVPMLLLAVGALTGRVRARSCCTVADPRRDTRMRGAFEQPPATRRHAEECGDGGHKPPADPSNLMRPKDGR